MYNIRISTNFILHRTIILTEDKSDLYNRQIKNIYKIFTWLGMCFKHTEINGGSINFIESFYYTPDKNDLKQNKIVIVYSLL